MADDDGLTPEQLREQLTAARGEAARYRTQLRDVEAERDGAFERVIAFQRSEIDHQLAVPIKDANGKLWLLEQADDLFAVGGVDLPDLLGEDGDVDGDLVREALEKLLTERPRLFEEKLPEMPRDPVAEALNRTRIGGGGAGGWAGLLSGGNARN
ncbi:hypothetical protein [Leifsonia sp. WHRI 6310E]|uniref:hypothetical protein n=1 Tax=Leifsonia sp. WHRI 6310E TaxID=3162562 RepID=UPI0032EC004D